MTTRDEDLYPDCGVCRGTGEGQWEGTYCGPCRGRGYVIDLDVEEFDAGEESSPFYDDGSDGYAECSYVDASE
jgi:RecJ-like exonuclease